MSKLNTNKIILGSAQFGRNYGISNFSNRGFSKNAYKTLELAFKNEIKFIDTAPQYNSEKIIGNFISAHGLSNEIKVFTKIPTISNKKNYRKFVINSVENSLKNLKCYIHTLFLHNTNDINLYKKNIDFFLKLKKIFPIKNLGFSIYSKKDLYITSKLGFKPVYQFPFNILDKRFLNLKIQKNKLIARSIFLQGLLINKKIKKKKLPIKLIESHNRYYNYLNNLKIDPLKFQLSYINSTKQINKFIIGSDNYQQLHQIINCELLKKIDTKHIKKINSFFNKNNIDPRKWK
tara:strand:+ start:47 stop:916 length:870 start_codon:yes stop_codon:yes gene_type:complete